jgi:hypothetical protein
VPGGGIVIAAGGRGANIAAIADICHRRGKPLIVDEA